ncbi:hypothetical protein [Meiothermus sp.]|uniref:DUF6812 domain-containing protein n=1 Tax=Meiothermus sp. TaxID=1955249 RepID=UPI00307F4E8F
MYRQPRDSFEARIYTREYRIYGNIYLVQAGGTADLLNTENRTHIPVTGALVYMAGLEHPPQTSELKADTPFTAVSKEDICWMVGGRPSVPKGNLALFERKRVALLFEGYILVGDLDIHKNTRLSDQLAVLKPFQTLSGAVLYRMPKQQPIVNAPPDQQFDFVTVHLSKADTVTEAPPPTSDLYLTLLG